MLTAIVLAIRATPKAFQACEDAKLDKDGAPLTRIEAVKASVPAFIPTMAACAGGLLCIFGANVLSRKQQASLMSAYAALEGAYRGYRSKVRQIMGDGTDQMVERAVEQEKQIDDNHVPHDEKQTFYFEANSHPRFFERTLDQVLEAEYHINRNMILRGYVTLNEFLDFLELDPVEGGEIVGWDQYHGETEYGYQWIDFRHRKYTTDDGLSVCSIETPFAPHPYGRLQSRKIQCAL